MSSFHNIMRLFANFTDTGDSSIAKALEGILESIRIQPELRLFVDGTVNCGHQAATVHLLRRLISLTGYRGRVTVVYADILAAGVLGRTPQKLALLLPGLDPNRIETDAVEYGTCAEIRFLNYDRRAELAGQAAFGFTAGADDMNINFARELKTDYFLRLQPYLWDDGPAKKSERFYQSSRVETAAHYFYPVDHYPPFRAIPYKYAKHDCAAVDDAVWDWYVEQSFDQNLKARTANMRMVYDAARLNPHLLLWPVYGLHQFRERQERIAANLVTCAREVQRFTGRRVVLTLLNDASEMADFGRIDQTETIAGYDCGRGKYVDVSAPLRDALAAPAADRVLVAAIGPVPGIIYNWLYANCPMPGVFEGQNTSSLAISLGRPFLQMMRGAARAGNPYPAKIGAHDLTQAAELAHQAAMQLRDSGSDGGGLANSAAFIAAVSDPGSPLHQYFQALGNYYQMDVHDKCLAGLVALSLSF